MEYGQKQKKKKKKKKMKKKRIGRLTEGLELTHFVHKHTTLNAKCYANNRGRRRVKARVFTYR